LLYALNELVPADGSPHKIEQRPLKVCALTPNLKLGLIADDQLAKETGVSSRNSVT
jgi:hypothetical protein